MNNIIRADFSNGATQVTTKPVYQYDYGQILKFSGVDLPESYEVHFANNLIGASKSVLGDANGVEIPYECTQKKSCIYAWIFIHYGESDGSTKYAITIPVIQRAKPSYDPVTPYEQSTIEKLENTVDGIRTDFQNVQEELNETVTEMQSDYQTFRTAVQEELNETVTEMQSDYQTFRTAVQEDVQTIQKKKADVIVSSASGSIAAFADGADDMPVESLKCYIEPVQDLHGYDHPWPAGGGKNLLPPGSDRLSCGITFTVNNDGTVTANGTASATAFWGAQFTIPAGTYIHSGCPSGVSGVTCDIRDKAGGSGISGIGTDSGNGVTFTISETLTAWYNIRVQSDTTLTNVVFKPMIRLASETDTTFAPYSNICPITGRTGVEVTRTGVNIWDEEWEVGAINASTGENVDSSVQIRSKNYIPVKPGMQLYIQSSNQAGTSPGNLQGRYYDKDKQYLGVNPTMYIGTVITIPEDCCYIRFGCQTTYGTTYNNDISINYPSTDHDYHAYQGQTIPISWQSEAGTVYGGYVDVVKGELVVDRAIITFDGSDDEKWTFAQFTPSSSRAYIAVPGIDTSTADSDIVDLISNIYKVSAYDSQSAPQRITGRYNIKQINVFVRTTTREEFISSLVSEPLQVVYPLATPITYQLTPQQLNTLLGNNSIYCDTGDVEVSYPADTKLYIDGKIAELQALVLEN